MSGSGVIADYRRSLLKWLPLTLDLMDTGHGEALLLKSLVLTLSVWQVDKAW